MLEGERGSYDTLRRILRLEEERGYTDTAVIGGLAAYVHRQTPELAPLVAEYAQADPFHRQRMVSRLRSSLDAPIEAPAAAGAEGSPPDPDLLSQPVTAAHGVGPKRADILRKLNIHTVEDLLCHTPRRLEDRTAFKTIGALRPGDQVCVRAEILAVNSFRVHGRRDAVKAALGDGSGLLYGVWFNQPWVAKQLQRGDEIVVFGKVERNYGEMQMLSPAWEPSGDSVETGRWVPIYPATEGATDRFLRSTIQQNLEAYSRHIVDVLPAALIERRRLPPRRLSIETLHAPRDPQAFEEARASLAFEELFLLYVGLSRTTRRARGAVHSTTGELATSFLAGLSFRLTADQHRALAEIVADLASETRMMRLLQGEVGSGKTIVALTAALHAIEAGYQVALMVPTELLASQHSAALAGLLEGLPVTLGELTASASGTQATREGIERGTVDIVVGTHALIQEGVSFHRLGLVIIDEQHRFGVVQRSTIEDKGDDVDLLVMSATPIPRTLALTLYGEFDVSVLRELPSGNRELRTIWVDSSRRDGVYARVGEELASGAQGYVILPLVEESEKSDLRAATQVAEELRARFPEHPVGLVHGRLQAAERTAVMSRFRAGEIRLLVATTVIEVGIDVADANLMVIEHAERFGLSQLHQLRGRIGRGGQPGLCFALASPTTDDARQRLEAFASIDDGFALAEADLRIRGPGDLLGTRQHGFLETLRAADLLQDVEIMESARREAQDAVEQGIDPRTLREVDRRFGELLRWLQV
jgi:ATP-dependent DNA helicase RecG